MWGEEIKGKAKREKYAKAKERQREMERECAERIKAKDHEGKEGGLDGGTSVNGMTLITNSCPAESQEAGIT